MDGRLYQPIHPRRRESWFPVPPDGLAEAQPDEIQQLSDAVRRALECPVCKELSGAMSTCCDNGHGLCDECSYTMNRLHPKKPPNCPLCRSPPARPDENGGPAAHDAFCEFAYGTCRPPAPASARKLQECMSAVMVTCAYRPNGCPVLVYVLSAAAHESLCPHAPHVRCMVPYCPWSGGYDDVFQHVAAEHQFSAYDLMGNEFLMPDLSFGLHGTMRRTYLTRNVRDGGRLYWVCVAQPTADGLQVAVLKVFDPDTTTRYTSKPPNMVFWVRTMSKAGWQQKRGRSRTVCWDRIMLDRMSGILIDSKYQERGLPSRDPIARSTTTDEGMGDRQQGVLRGSSLPNDNGTVENSSKPGKRDDKEQVAIMVPISVEPTKIVVQADVHNISDTSKKTDMNDKPEENHEMDVVVKSHTDDESDMNEKPNEAHTADISEKPNEAHTADMSEKPNATHTADMSEKPNATHTADMIEKPNATHTADMTEKPNETQTADKNKKSDEDVQSDVKAKKELENMSIKDQKNEQHVEEVCKNKENSDGDAEKISSDDSKDQVSELETEYRLTMIHSVREAVNRICEQAVEKTAAIVRNKGFIKRNSNASLISSLKDREADNSEAADNASSEFSLPPPPPPQQNPLDTGSIAQESSWPPPPTLSEAEEEKTIAPAGFSFDLPDPPTEMDQLDSETDKLDISDEEMRATGLPSDDDDKTDTEGGR